MFKREFWIKYKTPYLFLFPAFFVICVIVIYPIVYEIYISFLNRNLYTWGTNEKFIFLKNYISILKSVAFYKILGRTILWTFINLIFHVYGGLYYALLLEERLPGHKFIRSILILPWAIPQVILALAWRGEFNPVFGFINVVLGKIGIDPVPWMNHPIWTFVAPVIVNIWLGIPFMMTIISGGLQSINKEFYEAAKIDGASYFQQLRDITLPLLKPILTPAIIIGTIWTFNNLNVIYLVTTPSSYADILVTYVYKDAFVFYNFSSAAAFSILIFLILVFFSLIYIKITGTFSLKGKNLIFY
ncbi:MAG: sugar ABC transporter permease [Spirochaetes bacterium]|nr:sugar ABC transporter permease [Spirochaetota bacterium]